MNSRPLRTALALTVVLAAVLTGCTPQQRDGRGFTGEGAEYVVMVDEEFGSCVDEFGGTAYQFVPGGMGERQVGTVVIPNEDEDAALYWGVVTDVDDPEEIVLVPDASTGVALESLGC